MHIHISEKLTLSLAGTTIVVSVLWHIPAELTHFAREHFVSTAHHQPKQRQGVEYGFNTAPDTFNDRWLSSNGFQPYPPYPFERRSGRDTRIATGFTAGAKVIKVDSGYLDMAGPNGGYLDMAGPKDGYLDMAGPQGSYIDLRGDRKS